MSKRVKMGFKVTPKKGMGRWSSVYDETRGGYYPTEPKKPEEQKPEAPTPRDKTVRPTR